MPSTPRSAAKPKGAAQPRGLDGAAPIWPSLHARFQGMALSRVSDINGLNNCGAIAPAHGAIKKDVQTTTWRTLGAIALSCRSTSCPNPARHLLILRRSVGHAPFQPHIAPATVAAHVTAHADSAANTISESKIRAAGRRQHHRARCNSATKISSAEHHSRCDSAAGSERTRRDFGAVVGPLLLLLARSAATAPHPTNHREQEKSGSA